MGRAGRVLLIFDRKCNDRPDHRCVLVCSVSAAFFFAIAVAVFFGGLGDSKSKLLIRGVAEAQLKPIQKFEFHVDPKVLLSTGVRACWTMPYLSNFLVASGNMRSLSSAQSQEDSDSDLLSVSEYSDSD